MKPLWVRMREAADTLEEASRVYDAFSPPHYTWNAIDLRREADHVEAETQDKAEHYWHAGYGWPK